MYKLKNKLVFFLFVSVLFFIGGCKPKINELTFDANGLDFSNYVVVGTETSAGYMDGALYNQGQESSLAAILAKQFSVVGGGNLKQPLFNSSTGYGISGNSKLKLEHRTSCTGTTQLGAAAVAASGDAGIDAYIGNQSPFNNMSVPGIKSFQLQSQDFGNSNFLISQSYFYSRFATQPGQSTVLADAKNQGPTFFSFHVGSNDVMQYAIAGGDETVSTITADSVFKGSIENAIATLAATQAQGMVTNIPDIANLPYFTLIPYNALVLTQAEADSLNTLYALLNPAIHFTQGNNALVMEDAAATGQRRQIKSTEYVLLSVSLDSVNCGGWGSNTLKPLTDSFVLDATEINKIKTATSSFNTVLKNTAANYDLLFVDINAFYKTLKTGIIFNGVNYSLQYISGGLFSLDGINLNAKGNACLANECIKALNQTYGSRIPLADVNAYRGIVFP